MLAAIVGEMNFPRGIRIQKNIILLALWRNLERHSDHSFIQQIHYLFSRTLELIVFCSTFFSKESASKHTFRGVFLFKKRLVMVYNILIFNDLSWIWKSKMATNLTRFANTDLQPCPTKTSLITKSFSWTTSNVKYHLPQNNQIFP